MGLDDIAKGAALVIGVGIVAERFGAGTGLQSLGVGIKTIAAAPLGGTGAGLGEFASGLDQFAGVLSNIGKGIGDIFKAIPRGEGIPYIPFIKGAPVTPFAPQPYPSPDAGGGLSNIKNLSALPPLGRIYEVNGGVIGIRGISQTFASRREARDYRSAYNAAAAMDGTSL